MAYIELPRTSGILKINYTGMEIWVRSYLAFRDENGNIISSVINIANWAEGLCEDVVVMNPCPSVTYIKFNQEKNYIQYSLDGGKTYVLTTQFTQPPSTKLIYESWKVDGDSRGWQQFDFEYIDNIDMYNLYENNDNVYG